MKLEDVGVWWHQPSTYCNKRVRSPLDASYKLLLPCSTTIPTAPTDVSQFLDSAKTSLVDTAWSTLDRKKMLLVGTTGLMINATVLPIASSTIWSLLYSEQRTKHFLLAEVQPRRFWPHQGSANMVRQPGVYLQTKVMGFIGIQSI